MKNPIFKINKEEVWLYPEMNSAWFFVNVSKKASEDIKKGYPFIGKRGFGAVPVIVTIKETSWKTSIFPHKKTGVYILPLKAEVRKKENIKKGSIISYSIEVLI